MRRTASGPGECRLTNFKDPAPAWPRFGPKEDYLALRDPLGQMESQNRQAEVK